MDYRVISFHHQQFLVKPGDSMTVPGKMGTVGSTLKADTLLTSQAGQLALGAPYLPQASELTVVTIQKSKKIRVATYRAKSRYRRVKGHRQEETVLRFDDNKPVKKAKKSAPAA